MQNCIQQKTPPVALIIFNRPDYAQKIFNEIRRAQPKKLFVIADGPRTAEETLLCKKTRDVIDQVDWDCEVYKNYAVSNLGLKKRISSGITWFFENVESGIILEDDCLPHPSFFSFAAEMLEKYKNSETIMMISGDNFISDFKSNDSYFFSRYFPIWGWATWRRAWAKYDVDMQNWSKEQGKLLNKIYSQKYMVDYMTKLFNEAQKGTLRTWDVQWFYTCLINGGLSIIPRVNLISNIGLDGTHTKGSNQNLPIFDIYQDPIIHPKTIEQNIEYDNAFYERDLKPKQQPFGVSLRLKLIAIVVQCKIAKKIYRFFHTK